MILLISLSIYSCSKEDRELDQNDNITSELRNSSFDIVTDVRVTNESGILSFPSFSDFHSLKSELESASKSKALREDAYLSLGLNSDSDNFITEYPIGKVFESSLSFSSYRQDEEDRYEAHINRTHSDSGFDKDNILYFESVKSLFNADKQVKIGKKYFKVYDDNSVLMVGNNDRNTFLTLSNLPAEEIRTDYNVRVHQYELGEKSILFDYDQNNDLVEKNVIDLKIGFETQSDGSVFAVNSSFVDLVNNEPYSFVWEFEDGTTSTDLSPNKSIAIDEDVKLILDIDSGGGSGSGGDDWIIETRGDDDLCDHFFRVKDLGDCKFEVTIEIAWSDGVIDSVAWVLPNGSAKTGTNTTIGNKVTLTIDDSDEAQELQVTLFGNEYGGPYGIVCTATYELRCKCGDTGDKSRDTSVRTINGKKWKANCEIWTKDALFFASSTGSKTVTKRKGSFGVYYKKDVDMLAASFQGTLLDKAAVGCPEIFISFEEETKTDDHWLERNVNTGTDEARYEKGIKACESTHWFREGGITVRYTPDGGKLFLD